MEYKDLTHLSLFSGIGGIDLAAEWAGFRTVAFCEQNSFCQKVLHKHWPNEMIYDDVRTLNGAYFKNTTLLTGGFPCQPFSSAGKRNGKEDTRFLWPEMFRIIREARPTWVVGENVIGIVGFLEFEDILASLEKENYQVQPIIIPATCIGARQYRERVFIVASADGTGERRFSSTDRREESGNRFGVRTSGGGNDHAPSLRRAYFGIKDCFPLPLTAICRRTDGVPGWMDRLGSLGNAVIPQQIYPILKTIADIENGVIVPEDE